MSKETRAPVLQRLGIVQAQDFDVSDKQPRALDRGQHLREGRDITARKDVFRDPGIGDVWPFRTADEVEEHHPVIIEELDALLKEFTVMPNAHMLEHADRDDAVERPGAVTAVLQPTIGLV